MIVFSYRESLPSGIDNITDSWCMGGTGQCFKREELCRCSAASEPANYIVPRQIKSPNARDLCYSI